MSRWRREPIVVENHERLLGELRLADYFHQQVARPERELPQEPECGLAMAQSA